MSTWHKMSVKLWHKLFIRNTHAIFGVPNHSSLQIFDKTQAGVFSISAQVNKNCQKSRTSSDIDMKLGLLTELGKRNTATSKKLTIASC